MVNLKRYISSLLIPCFLLHLIGCYSVKEMTIEELKSFEGDDDILLKTKLEDVIINRKSCKDSSMNWVANDNVLNINVIKPLTMENYKNLNSKDYYEATHQEIEIRYSDVESIEIIEIEGIDFKTTTGFILGILLPTVIIVFHRDLFH